MHNVVLAFFHGVKTHAQSSTINNRINMNREGIVVPYSKTKNNIEIKNISKGR